MQINRKSYGMEITIQNYDELVNMQINQRIKSKSNQNQIEIKHESSIKNVLEIGEIDKTDLSNTPPTPSRGEIAFEDFWNKYPKKVGKGAARVAYQKAIRTAEHSVIVGGLEKYAGKWKEDRTDIQYIPNPSTWLSQERWNDEVQISNRRKIFVVN